MMKYDMIDVPDEHKGIYCDGGRLRFEFKKDDKWYTFDLPDDTTEQQVLSILEIFKVLSDKYRSLPTDARGFPISESQ